MMGREIKRIALDFDYPINKMIWKGYHNPYRGLKCECCDGSGYSKEYKELQDKWYYEGWRNNLDQDDVQVLLDNERLWDFTRVPLNDEHRAIIKQKMADGGNSCLPFDNGYVPTAKEVNEWSLKGFGHDSSNAWHCISAKLKKLGLPTCCDVCNGDGCVWPSDEYKELHDNFTDIEPPAGEGYQLWATTTEGTPMSPVFSEPEQLATWLYENKASSFGSSTCSYEEWLRFIVGPGWCVSMAVIDGEMVDGVRL